MLKSEDFSINKNKQITALSGTKTKKAESNKDAYLKIGVILFLFSFLFMPIKYLGAAEYKNSLGIGYLVDMNMNNSLGKEKFSLLNFQLSYRRTLGKRFGLLFNIGLKNNIFEDEVLSFFDVNGNLSTATYKMTENIYGVPLEIGIDFRIMKLNKFNFYGGIILQNKLSINVVQINEMKDSSRYFTTLIGPIFEIDVLILKKYSLFFQPKILLGNNIPFRSLTIEYLIGLKRHFN